MVKSGASPSFTLAGRTPFNRLAERILIYIHLESAIPIPELRRSLNAAYRVRMCQRNQSRAVRGAQDIYLPPKVMPKGEPGDAPIGPA